MFHRSHDHGCSEKAFQGDTSNLPGLTVPVGLTPPDTRNQVKIPTLNEPERMRAKNEPCLAQPPSYATGSPIAIPVRSGAPIGVAPAAPVPISPVEPAPPVEPAVPAPSVPAPSAPAPSPQPPVAPIPVPDASKPQPGGN